MEENSVHLLKNGRTLGSRYVIEGVLGEGGFGITYRGHDKTLDVEVAIKEYYPQGFVTRNTTYSEELTVSQSKYTEMFQKVEEDLRYLMEIPDDYDILFQQGGATLQFTAVPLNLANNYQRIGYIDTGHWSQRAYQEAELLHKFDVDVIASSKDSNYTELVHQVELGNKKYDYVHLTTNNTIEGTMYRDLPSGLDGQTIVADMSSNILGQKYNVDDFGFV